MKIYEGRAHFNRSELVTSALILNSGPVTGYDVMKYADIPSGTVYPSLKSALEYGTMRVVETPESYEIKGPVPKFYDLTIKGLLLAHIELGLVQVPDLSVLINARAQEFDN